MNIDLGIFGIAISVAAYHIAKMYIDYLRDKEGIKRDDE